jgi:hypothetical protein
VINIFNLYKKLDKTPKSLHYSKVYFTQFLFIFMSLDTQKLLDLKQLLDTGVIDQDTFNKEKQAIIGAIENLEKTPKVELVANPPNPTFFFIIISIPVAIIILAINPSLVTLFFGNGIIGLFLFGMPILIVLLILLVLKNLFK